MMIMMQSRRSLLFLRPRSIPFTHTYRLVAIAKMRRNPMKRKDSRLLALTLCVLKSIVQTSWPCAVPKLVRRTTARQPPSGVHAGSPGLDCRTLVPPNSTAGLCTPSSRDENPPPTARSILQERRRFTREHGLIDDARATDEQRVGRNGGFRVLTHLTDCSLYINIKTPSVDTRTHLVTQHPLGVRQSGP